MITFLFKLEAPKVSLNRKREVNSKIPKGSGKKGSLKKFIVIGEQIDNVKILFLFAYLGLCVYFGTFPQQTEKFKVRPAFKRAKRLFYYTCPYLTFKMPEILF